MSSYFWTNEKNISNNKNESKQIKNSASESELNNILNLETHLPNCLSDSQLQSNSFLNYISEEVKKNKNYDIFVVMIDGKPVKYTKTEKEASEYIFNETKNFLISLNMDINNNYYLQIIDNDHINIVCVPKFFFIKYSHIETSYRYFKIESL